MKWEPSVRLCCGERHAGATCPDGKVMCCLCFNRFEPQDLHLTADGRREDVCVGCTDLELSNRAAEQSKDIQRITDCGGTYEAG